MYYALNSVERQEFDKNTTVELIDDTSELDTDYSENLWSKKLVRITTIDGEKAHSYDIISYYEYDSVRLAIYKNFVRLPSVINDFEDLYAFICEKAVTLIEKEAYRFNPPSISITVSDPHIVSILSERGYKLHDRANGKEETLCMKSFVF